MMNELESKIQTPTVEPSRLLALVGNLTSSSDMRLSQASAAARLNDIADHNGGEVPLHGRLFAEFLHVAFPMDCPYPHISEDASVLSAGHWSGGKATASPEERRLHVEGESHTAEDEDIAEGLPFDATSWSE